MPRDLDELPAPRPEDLVYWAANSQPHGLLERAEGAAAAGFGSVTCVTGDFEALERESISLEAARERLEDLQIRMVAIDPFLAWYPGFDPTIGIAAALMPEQIGATVDDVLRWTAELAIPFISTVGPVDDPSGQYRDHPTAPFEAVVESLGEFVDRAAATGTAVMLEPVPTTKIPDLATAVDLAEKIDSPSLGLLIDTYNLSRAGTTPEELEAVDAKWIFHLQLSDGPREPSGDNYFEEAHAGRVFAGEGELPVTEMVSKLRANGPLPPTGPEVFNSELHEQPPAVVARLARQQTLDFLSRIEAEHQAA